MKLIEKMLQTDNQVCACWLGNDGWLFAHDGHLIATDLDFFSAELILPPFTELEELAQALDYLLVTHAHGDHYNVETIRYLLGRGRCTIILPESCRSVAHEHGLDPERIIFTKSGFAELDLLQNPLPVVRTGGMVSGLPTWLNIEAIRALHGHIGGSVYTGASVGDCGYIIGMGGKRIVQPGDSVLLEEHLSLHDIDLLLVSPTEHNMGIEKARYLIEAIRPGRVFAQHFNTYRESPENAFWTHGYQQELLNALSQEMRTRYAIPAYAEQYYL